MKTILKRSFRKSEFFLWSFCHLINPNEIYWEQRSKSIVILCLETAASNFNSILPLHWIFLIHQRKTSASLPKIIFNQNLDSCLRILASMWNYLLVIEQIKNLSSNCKIMSIFYSYNKIPNFTVIQTTKL